MNKELTYQEEVDAWMKHCFGDTIRLDKIERNYRFLEEALETVQSANMTKEDAYKLVDYVFGRPKEENLCREVGGVMVTLAAMCTAHGLDMEQCGLKELARCWQKTEKIREKQANKQIKSSPLP